MFESIGEIRKLHDLINLTEILSIPVLFEFFKLFIVSEYGQCIGLLNRITISGY